MFVLPTGSSELSNGQAEVYLCFVTVICGLGIGGDSTGFRNALPHLDVF